MESLKCHILIWKTRLPRCSEQKIILFLENKHIHSFFKVVFAMITKLHFSCISLSKKVLTKTRKHKKKKAFYCSYLTISSFFSPLCSLFKRQKDQWQVFLEWPCEETLSHRQRRLQRPGRCPWHTYIQGWERWVQRLRPPKHRPRWAGVAGHQRYGNWGHLDRPDQQQHHLQKLGHVQL